jgi:hypothetical protein
MTSPLVAIAPNPGPIRDTRVPSAGLRWLIRAVSAEGLRGWTLPRRLLPDVAAALVGRPLRWVRDRNGELGHPIGAADPEDPRWHVGRIVDAWARPWAVLCVAELDDDAVPLRRLLARLDRLGQLPFALGVSIHAHGEKAWPDPASVQYVATTVDGVYGLDFVTRPADRTARVLRALAPGEDPNPTKETSP